jgi:hypothetical protein
MRREPWCALFNYVREIQQMKGKHLFAGIRMVVFLVAAGLALSACDQLNKIHFGDDPAELAKKRVHFILGTLQLGVSGTSKEMQTAICRFDQDLNAIMDRDRVGLAMEAFDQWRLDGRIYDGVSSFEIAPEVGPAKPQDPPDTVYVRAKINGTWHWIRVPKGERLTWVRS